MARNGGGLVSRKLSGAGVSNDISGDIQSSRKFGQTPTLQRAVVIDVIMDPNLLSEEQLARISRTVNNPKFAYVLPVNAIIAKLTSNAQGTIPKTNTILFPFFSSHFMLPIQPGETVEVIYEDYSGNGPQVGYWLTRTSMERTVEDPNYTHFDRRFQPFNNPANFSTGDKSNRKETQPPPGFPNGGNTPETFTIAPLNAQDRPYERIIEQATAYSNGVGGLENFSFEGTVTTPEPVPRWRKRPQEFVLQGANNTLICLGEDRKAGPLGALVDDDPDAKFQAGTIDIVAGRGRFLPENNQEPLEVFENNTAPFVTDNESRGQETYKTPFLNIPGEGRIADNPIEGDPDLVRDAARLYVTMQSNVDRNFGITDIQFTENSLPEGDSKNQIMQPSEAEEKSLNKSYVAAKADHIRLIARKDEDNGVAGTVLILREGETEKDLCHLYISKEGVHIDGPKVIVGRGLAKVASPKSDPTPGGEPWIRWSKFRDTIDSMQEEIKGIREALQAEHSATQEAIFTMANTIETAFASAIAKPYKPIASLFAIGLTKQLSTPVGPTGLKNKITTGGDNSKAAYDKGKKATDKSVEASKSTKIFGE